MKKHILLSITLLAFMLSFLSCQKEEDPTKTPKVTEESVEAIATTATFSWTVDWLGKFASMVEVSENEDMSDSQTFGSETETENKDFTATATGLKAETRYYYRYLVWNKYFEDNKFQTNVKSFITLYDGLATVTTAAVSNVSSCSVKCGGDVTYDGNHTVTERGLCWSTSPNPDINGSHVSSGEGPGAFTCSIANLEPETNYHVRAYATNSVGTSYGTEVSFTTKAVPTGAINAIFSVSSSEQVYFSQGNLQYIGSTGTWKFADNQWDIIGTSQGNSSSSTTRDLFGWGTSGWSCGNTYYRPYDTYSVDYYYGPHGDNDLTDSYANSDWGVYNAISNGGNQSGLWRTLTSDEWWYVLNTREGSLLNAVADARYAKAMVNDIAGVILFPDSYTHPNGVPEPSNINTYGAGFTSNSYSGDNWDQMEQAGCVFFPAAGQRYETSVSGVGVWGSLGVYWSVSGYGNYFAYFMTFDNSSLHTGAGGREFGMAVRLVRDAQ